ncbi:2-C-methyl-D-erythritol 4-phosphate cytidylyltransferase [Flavonifractor sp. HCP28S3_F3]|uniref:2-C-methyl-D-erythritol 4-phosphate cytidylyltransferase n=1 Tax=Flavonifractor sp. HCP28S3_F3 TaxID=3438939 RepID=UPI003F8C70A9
MAGLLSRLFGKKGAPSIRCAAVVPAAGSSTRMAGRDKILLPLGDQPVLVHTLRALELCPHITEIVVVTRRDLIVPIGQLCRDCGFQKVTKVIPGGETRTQSVLNGVSEVSKDAELIAIHDGARPLVTQSLLDAVIARASQCGAAAPAVPVKDTIKRAKDGVVSATLDRSELFAVQTPQVFQADLIRTALARAMEEGAELTDDCGAVERLGIGVALTQGDYRNLKVTTPEDMAMAEALLEWEDET